MSEEKIKYIPLGLFCLAFLKSLILTPSWEEVAFLALLGGVATFYTFFTDEKRFKLFHSRLDEADKHLTELYKKHDDLKSEISGVKVSQGFRSTTIFGNK